MLPIAFGVGKVTKSPNFTLYIRTILHNYLRSCFILHRYKSFLYVACIAWYCIPGGYCYRESNNLYTWDSAESDCINYYKGELATVDTQIIHDYLVCKGVISARYCI